MKLKHTCDKIERQRSRRLSVESLQPSPHDEFNSQRSRLGKKLIKIANKLHRLPDLPPDYNKQELLEQLDLHIRESPDPDSHRVHQLKILTELVLHGWSPAAAQLLSGQAIPEAIRESETFLTIPDPEPGK